MGISRKGQILITEPIKTVLMLNILKTNMILGIIGLDIWRKKIYEKSIIYNFYCFNGV